MNRKSVWALAAGVVFILVVTTLVDLALHAAKVYPGWGQPLDDRLSLIATSYRVVIGVAGAWLTARLAPGQPMRHAMILGYVGTVLGLIGVLGTWDKGLGPRWYPIALMALAIPQSWLGGKLLERSRR